MTKRRQAPRAETLAAEYQHLWDAMEIRPERAGHVTAVARRILAGRRRYEAIEYQTGVPWWIVGTIHAMESSCNFNGHLHNGDPLIARTVQEPKGRPIDGDGPFSFEDSASDALLMKDLDQVARWDVPTLCYQLERYNGWGYRLYHAEVLSPYLWSMTNHYRAGKYVADGSWSPTAISGQPGAVALVHRLMELEPSIVIPDAAIDPAQEFVATPERAETAPSSMATSSTGNTAGVIAAGGAANTATELSGAATKVAAAGKPFTFAEFAFALMQSPTFWIGFITTLGGVYIWLERAQLRRRWGV